MATWEQVNGPEVLPPVYQKKVGRPPKNRRKQPHEVQGPSGTRMSRHGVTVTCSYCGMENHNARGCFLKKNGIRPEDYVPDPEVHEVVQDPVISESPTQQEDNDQVQVTEWFTQQAPPFSQLLTQEAPPVSQDENPTQHVGGTYLGLTPTCSQLLSNMSSTMLLHMMDQAIQASPKKYFFISLSNLDALCSQASQSTAAAKPLGPLPDSTFISTNTPVPRPAPLTTATKQGKMATKGRKGKKTAPEKKTT